MACSLVYDFLKENLEKTDPCLVCQINIYVDKWWSRMLRKFQETDPNGGNQISESIYRDSRKKK